MIGWFENSKGLFSVSFKTPNSNHDACFLQIALFLKAFPAHNRKKA